MKELINGNNIDVNELYNDVSNIIDDTKQRVVFQINTELIDLTWNIGNRIKKELLKTRNKLKEKSLY